MFVKRKEGVNVAKFDDFFQKKVVTFLKEGDGWRQRQNESSLDIEVCSGTAVADPLTHTCEICVAINRTIFKNNNKPDEKQHPYCKCEQVPIGLNEVTLDFPIEKIKDYLFVQKVDLMKEMGYIIEDTQEVYDVVAESAKREFLKGNYALSTLNRHGQRVSITVELKGKRDKNGRIYRFVSGWMAYPNGKLHNNTPFSRFAEKGRKL